MSPFWKFRNGTGILVVIEGKSKKHRWRWYWWFALLRGSLVLFWPLSSKAGLLKCMLWERCSHEIGLGVGWIMRKYSSSNIFYFYLLLKEMKRGMLCRDQHRVGWVGYWVILCASCVVWLPVVNYSRVGTLFFCCSYFWSGLLLVFTGIGGQFACFLIHMQWFNWFCLFVWHLDNL